MVFWLTVTIGTEEVDVGVMLGVSVGKGVLLGISVMPGGGVVRTSAKALAVAAASASAVAVPGDWDGRLQADNPRIMTNPTIKIFLVLFIVNSRM